MNSETLITHPDQVTTAWLTHVLTRSGALTTGAVQSCKLETGQGNWSTSANLRLTYTPDASGECPRSLFLNFELTLAVYDRDFSAELDRLQASYLAQSRPLELAECLKQSFPARLIQDTARLLEPLP